MERLLALRKKRNWKQKDVANMLGIHVTTYTKYETGASEPKNEMLLKLADIFGTSTDYLLGRTNEPAPGKKGGQSKTVRQIMDCVYRMSPKEQEAFLAWLQESQGRG